MHRLLRTSLAVLSCAATFVAASALPATRVPTGGAQRAEAAVPPDDAYQGRLLSLVNRERTLRGLRPLRLSRCVDGYAERWSLYLARAEVLRHQSLDPVLNSCRARQAGENIGDESGSADALVRSWMASPRHRNNILNPRFTDTALRAARSSSGRWYAVQEFVGF